MDQPRTVIIGLGNPVLTDDGVGIHVARSLAERFGHRPEITVREIYSGGLDLMEAMSGFDRAVVIDAIVTGKADPGSMTPLKASDLKQSRNSASNHDASLEVALELGSLAGLDLPREVRIWAIEAKDVESFGETLTEPLRRALPGVIATIARDLEGPHGPWEANS